MNQDPELIHQPTTRPGAKLPHAWLVDAKGERISTLDLVAKGEFTVLTGLSGGMWDTAAGACREALAVPLRVVRIGAQNARDTYGEWARISEIAEDGMLLVRPDGYIAWRRATGPETTAQASAALLDALRNVLQR